MEKRLQELGEKYKNDVKLKKKVHKICDRNRQIKRDKEHDPIKFQQPPKLEPQEKKSRNIGKMLRTQPIKIQSPISQRITNI
jgi:hypothetical protein